MRERTDGGKKSPLLLTVKNVMVVVPWGSLTAWLSVRTYPRQALSGMATSGAEIGFPYNIAQSANFIYKIVTSELMQTLFVREVHTIY